MKRKHHKFKSPKLRLSRYRYKQGTTINGSPTDDVEKEKDKIPNTVYNHSNVHIP